MVGSYSVTCPSWNLASQLIPQCPAKLFLVLSIRGDEKGMLWNCHKGSERHTSPQTWPKTTLTESKWSVVSFRKTWRFHCHQLFEWTAKLEVVNSGNPLRSGKAKLSQRIHWRHAKTRHPISAFLFWRQQLIFENNRMLCFLRASDIRFVASHWSIISIR